MSGSSSGICVHPPHQLSPNAGVTYGVKFVGAIPINSSMKATDYKTRTKIARECIWKVCEEIGLRTTNLSLNRKKSLKASQVIGSHCLQQLSSAAANLRITTHQISLTRFHDNTAIISHNIFNVSFASGGDQETKEFIAYAGKDEQFGRACFVIECPNNLAAEIINTIGQAFQIRYKEVSQRPAAPGGGDSNSSSSSLSNHLISTPPSYPPPSLPLIHPPSAFSGRGGGIPNSFNMINPSAPFAAPSAPAASAFNSPPNVPPPAPPTAAAATVAPTPMPRNFSVPIDKLLDIDLPTNIPDSDEGVYKTHPNQIFGKLSDENVGGAILLTPSPRKISKPEIFVPPPMPPPPPLPPLSLAISSSSEEMIRGGGGGGGGGSGIGMIVAPVGESWFVGTMSRANAEQMLRKDGEFLVRASSQQPGQFVLSGRQNGQFKHLLLVDPDGKVRTKDRVFHGISHLIQFHIINNLPIRSADSEIRLLYPVVVAGPPSSSSSSYLSS